MSRQETVTITNMCMVYDGALVLVQDRKDPQWPGLTFPGGHVEKGESFTDAVIREVLEETGLIAEELEFFLINSGEETHYIYPNGDEVYNVEIVYLCRHYHGTLRPQEEELSELHFFPVNEIPDEISDPIIPVIHAFKQYAEKN